jgi:hypothetical protein
MISLPTTYFMWIRRRSALSAALLALSSLPGFSQPLPSQPTKVPKETPEQFAKRTKWWREAKFGMFIHWGLYAVPADATFKDGKTKGIAEWYFSNKQMHPIDYGNNGGRLVSILTNPKS